MSAVALGERHSADPTQLQLALVGGWSLAQAARSRRTHRRGFHRCESPLERQLALALSRTVGFAWRGPRDHLWAVGSWPARSLILIAQAEWHTYRADFALVPAGWSAPAPLALVIEVDGHDFHERTKEQAEYDRKRDRLLIHSGATVLRFTGREVWRDAEACAAEVLDIAGRG